ncbi:MAG: glycosyltransferase family 9 protein [Pseudobdellovibrionaceae bacterium]|nr:glycosyltransferase family 9 protein [Bdellovibrionales bacterium]USN46447.1 MAG: glycosyltransferase family 9 protein [Pseudobdellovibrionaceae bacterium]
MKILVLQLARYGDLLQTVPTLNALRRVYPSATIDLLARGRYAPIVKNLAAVDNLIEFDSREILEPIVNDAQALSKALDAVESFTDGLADCQYDQIINLSFSPLSSYLVSAIAHKNTKVCGYTRHSDGFLAIPDDTSAYFYAQVGVDKFNRLHLTDIFAAVSGVELVESDFVFKSKLSKDSAFKELSIAGELGKTPYVVLHPGASQIHKTLDPFKWRQVVRHLLSQYKGAIVILGSENEEPLGEAILDGLSHAQVVNGIGKTDFEDLFAVVRGAEAVVGGDSMMMHVASLEGVPCLNLSFSSVNFWETGPRSLNSRVIYSQNNEDVSPDAVVRELMALLNNTTSGMPVYCRAPGGIVSYQAQGEAVEEAQLQWDLIQAIYLGAEFPMIHNELVAEGLYRLAEVAQVGLIQINDMKNPKTRQTAMSMFSQLDLLLQGIEKMVPSLQPLISWFQTERLRIGPGSFDQVIKATEKCFNDLLSVLSLYLGPNPGAQQIEEEYHGNHMDAK